MVLFSVLGALVCIACAALADTFEQQLGETKVGAVDDSGAIQVPYITWGGDVPTFVANGGTTTTKDSLYGKAGLNLKLVNGDDFHQQVKDYLSGKSPYLRGTLGMLSLASEVINKDPKTRPVMILQLTWSAGDHIVGREGIKNLNQLKGKKVCLQKGGPHLTLLDDSLKAAGLKWEDVTVVYAKNLTGPDSPGEMFKKDASIDACCVISPDMIGLCSGIDQKGSGAEGTVKGAHVINSTATMSHSIADVYVVRKDYFDKHKDEVEKFVVGYLKATEQLLEWKKTYNDGKGKSPEYMAALKQAQTILGAKVLPTLENDAHGLVCDATFVRIPGNDAFFNEKDSLIGFDAKTGSALDMSKNLGFTTDKFGFTKADWDYKKIAEGVGVKYSPPVRLTGRVKGEVTDFTKDLDSNTIFSFEIKFDPEQTTFNIDSYAADFQRVVSSSQTFGNAVILIRGHSDPTLALQNFFWAAKAKGLITGDGPNYKFKGQPLNLADTNEVIKAIQGENLAGQKRVNSDGKEVAIDDPKVTVAAALQLSQTRAANVKKSLEEFAKKKGYVLDLSQIQPQGVGIAEPINARPRNMNQAKENMRVEFRVIRVRAESLREDDFNFDK
jgi:ABC-type nitrate/sulfonate/bicarbonate transport system substrate-binding protein/outer membrane protein OmpA-like peptidoglycan-associated protein